jgi:PAS domain-containing protein
MWEFLTLIVVAVAGIVGLHFWWRGRFLRLQGQLQQTTGDLAAAREEQRRREARQQAGTLTLFDHMVEGVLWLDAAGRIQLANPSLGRMLAASGDVRGRTLLEAFRLPELSSRCRASNRASFRSTPWRCWMTRTGPKARSWCSTT